MVTLIARYTSEGCVGRCDEKCYLAKLPDCDCICLGRNHGVGLDQARDNTEEYAERWIEKARQAGQGGDFVVSPEAAMTPLFGTTEIKPAPPKGMPAGRPAPRRRHT